MHLSNSRFPQILFPSKSLYWKQTLHDSWTISGCGTLLKNLTCLCQGLFLVPFKGYYPKYCSENVMNMSAPAECFVTLRFSFTCACQTSFWLAPFMRPEVRLEQMAKFPGRNFSPRSQPKIKPWRLLRNSVPQQLPIHHPMLDFRVWQRNNNDISELYGEWGCRLLSSLAC